MNDDSKLAAEDMAGALRISKATQWHLDKDWVARDAHREKLMAALESGSKVIVPKALLDHLEVLCTSTFCSGRCGDCIPWWQQLEAVRKVQP